MNKSLNSIQLFGLIILMIIGFFVVGFFSISPKQAVAQNLAYCLRMELQTQVEGEWPGGTIRVSCDGDTGINCRGTSTSVTPGKSVILDNCSCPPYAPGCIDIPAEDITKKGCTSQLTGPSCGTNGNTIKPVLKIVCKKPPSPTPVSSCLNKNPDGTANECVSGSACRTGQVPKPDGDWACKNGGYGDVCCTIKPTATPTTPAEQTCPNNSCYSIARRGTQCQINGNLSGTWQLSSSGGSCSQGGTFCFDCVPNPTGSPSATPSLTPTQPPGVTQPPVVTTPPTQPPGVTQPPIVTTPPTPTPDVTAMCKCDQMNVQQIVAGQPIQVEAFAKVEGQDTSKAEVQGMNFRIYEGNPASGNNIPVIERATRPVSIVSNTQTLVRYRSDWTVNPQIKNGVEYRIQAVPNCVQKTAALQQQTQRAVLAERDENIGFFGQIKNFFAGIFGGGDEIENNNEGLQIAEEDQGPFSFITNFFKPQTNNGGKQLQIDSFTPAQMEKEACNIMKFKIEG